MIMKHALTPLLFLTLLFQFSENLRAQSLVADTVFHFSVNDAVNAMLVDEIGEAILVGKMETDSLTPKNIWVKRLGFQGDTLVIEKWQKIFYPGNASRVSKAIWTEDGNILIAGSWNSNHMLLKMDAMTGDSLTMLLLPGTADTYIQDVAELPGGDLILLVVDVDLDLYSRVMRVTAGGSVTWDVDFDDRYYTSLEYYNDDSIMVAGYEYHQDYQHILYGSYSPVNWDPHFSNMYQEFYGTNYCMVADSGAIYLGNRKEYISSGGLVSQVLKLTPGGEVEWEVDFTGIGSKVVRDIHVYDNYLLTISERVLPNQGWIIIGAITFDGVLADAYGIGKPVPEAVAIDTYENYMYITGRQFNSGNGKDVFFMKFNLDSLFVISGAPERSVAASVQLYPNPASHELCIDLQGSPESRLASVRIYSMQGRIVGEMRMPEGPVVRLPVSGLPEGLYVVALHFDDGPPVTRKILVAH